MNFMSIYANIYNWTRVISKIFLIYLSVLQSCSSLDKILNLIFKYQFKDKIKFYDFIGCLDYLGLLWTDSLVNPSAFKSFVSTNFTTRALMNFMSIYANIYNWTRLISKFFLFYLSMLQSCSSCPILSYKNLYYLTPNITFKSILLPPLITLRSTIWSAFSLLKT